MKTSLQHILKEVVDESSLSLVEDGILFKTGVPVTFKYFRGTVKAPNFGSRYQQDIEPAGRYMVHIENPHLEGKEYETGTVTFNNPLVIVSNTVPFNHYDENSWKVFLSKKYRNLKGKSLSKAIVRDGYDGIITLNLGRNEIPYCTGEIVDLTMFK